MAKHLTPAFIRKAKPGFYPDPEVRGLRLAVGKSTRTWIYRHRFDKDGRRLLKQVVVGREGAMTLAEAREKVRYLKAGRATGLAPRRLLEGERAKHADRTRRYEREWYSVGKLVAHYLDGHIKRYRKPKSIASVQRLFARIPKNFLEEPAPALRRATAHELVQSFEAPSMQRMAGRELRAAWDHAIATGKLDEGAPNPFKNIKLPPQDSRDCVLSLEEIKNVLPWIDALSPAARDVLRVTLYTGMRTGEVAAAQTQHLNGETLLLPETKNGKARTVQLPRQAAAILHARAALPRKRKGDAVHLFPSPTVREQAIAQKAVGLAFWKAQATCPVEFRPHDLRRTCATQLAELKLADGDLIELILGHSRQGVRKIYNLSKRESEQRAALQAWADRLDAL